MRNGNASGPSWVKVIRHQQARSVLNQPGGVCCSHKAGQTRVSEGSVPSTMFTDDIFSYKYNHIDCLIDLCLQDSNFLNQPS